MTKLFRKKYTPRQTQVYGDDNFAIAEAYKTVRTNIMFSLSDVENGKVIILTSPGPCEGKSTSALNVAVNFAKMGKKTLLIDADLRKPRIHKAMGVEHEGLANYLGGFSEFDQVIAYSEEYGLDLMVCGTIPPNPSELLASNKMTKLVDRMKEQYDYIIIDTPPVNVVTDAVILSKLASGVVVVVREGSTTYTELSKAIETLEFAESRLLGIVVNDSVGLSKGYKYKGRYSRYYYRYEDYSYSYKEKE
ncbi:CpsD/CapB family tyrosine-protein kinase [Acetivibrio sp. MSJd-27]|uniref:CpsD/CapB family tyrosine-protein kinase n=1 Tax=Acetivibrio sp. MSJd-27 TaxID=2841523 RepID=UPI001C0FA447|nr:CpsD/CapB family tyrosine-protein kinase [Acetivibrio sp. MSJd-27]MBU5450776.1 CpsD/CapB family tyrosine-protein kinase [Acetivibrio sp. MSJd-27]